MPDQPARVEAHEAPSTAALRAPELPDGAPRDVVTPLAARLALGAIPGGGLPPGASGQRALLSLQRSAGNRAALGLLAGARAGARPPPHQRTRAPIRPPQRSPAPGQGSFHVDRSAAAPAAGGGRPAPAVAEASGDTARASAGAEAAVAAVGPAFAAADNPPLPGAGRESAAVGRRRQARAGTDAPTASTQLHPLQRQLAVQRAGPGITPKFNIEISPDKWKKDFGKASYVKGEYGLKGEIAGELLPKGGEASPLSVSGTSNKGAKTEIVIAEQKAIQILAGLEIESVKEALSFELALKKLAVELTVEAQIKTRYPWLKGLAKGAFKIVDVDWEEMSKDPGSPTALGIEVAGGLQGEGTIGLTEQTDLKLAVQLTPFGSIAPNWPRIAGEVGKRVATEGGKAALTSTTTAAGTQVVTVNLGAVAASAAAIIVPLAAAAAMGYGAYQGAKNIKAARDAANAGVAAKKKAKECARGFAMTLTGHSPAGDEGSLEADAQINATMASTQATREMVIAAATKEQGGYAAIYEKNLKRIKQTIYEEACRTYDEAHRESWGFIEELGPSWGFRGVYRKYLGIILFAT